MTSTSGTVESGPMIDKLTGKIIPEVQAYLTRRRRGFTQFYFVCCPFCGRKVRDAAKLRRHLSTAHDAFAPSIPRGKRRHDTYKFTYIKLGDIKMGDTANPTGLEEHYGCASCLGHYADFEELKSHMVNEHLPQES